MIPSFKEISDMFFSDIIPFDFNNEYAAVAVLEPNLPSIPSPLGPVVPKC